MNTKLVQRQEQKAVQRQHLTQQQIMYVRLLEMPLAEFEENVRMEMDDNPALEVDDNGDPALETSAGEGSYGEDVLWDGEDDGQEVRGARSEVRGEMVWSDSLSFYDKLKEQMGELDLTAEERDVLEYIIGSLDDDGLLRKPLDSICDELAIYHNIDITEKDA
jgi:RNA polymerase sigma-54 factor